jgi:putative ABC transport system ATP-binding protein
MKNEIIKVEKVKKIYSLGETKVHALNGVSLAVEKGDFVVIVGPSGSGKSTLLHLMGALDHPTHGSIFIDGDDISHYEDNQLAMLRRNKMGFIFQAFNLIPTLTALENVLIPTEPTKMDPDEADKKAKEILTVVGLEHRMHHKPDQLSGGERQRVSIARSLINDPDIIYADEPTGNLDTVTGDKIIQLMKNLTIKEKKTFIVVTHDESLLNFATKKFTLRDGLLHKIERGNHIARKYVD